MSVSLADIDCLNDSHIEALGRVRGRAQKISDQPLLPFFTDHTISHLDRVASHALDLASIGEDGYRLNHHELFVLLGSCYLHDVGLNSSQPAGDTSVKNLGVDELSEIRNKHPQLAANWILESVKEDGSEDIPTLGVTTNQVSRELAPFVAKICRYHSGEIPDLDDKELWQKPIRMDLILHLLRLADALDLDSRRVRMEKLDLWKVNPESLFHWWRHHYVDSVRVNDTGIVTIQMTFPDTLSPPYIERFVGHVRDEIKQEIDPARQLLFKNHLPVHLDDISYESRKATNKRPPPQALRDYLDRTIGSEDTDTSGMHPVSGGAGESWISYWGFSGNPWADIPIAHEHEAFVETEGISKKFDEVRQIIEADQGALRLVFGERGAGKTTFLRALESRFEDRAIYSFQDLSTTFAPKRNPETLFSQVFPGIMNDLKRGPATEEDYPDYEDMTQVLSRIRSNYPIILIDNLDRFTREAHRETIQEFFRLAQGNFQALKQESLVVISASQDWKETFGWDDLGYIGQGAFWDIQRFTEHDAERLLQNRLEMAGSSFEAVFEDHSVAKLIHQVSDGNPRDILHFAQIVCQRAAQDSEDVITRSYIEDRFSSRVERKISSMIRSVGGGSLENRRALEGLYKFHLSIEQADHSEDDAWESLRGLISEGSVPKSGIENEMVRHLSTVSDLKSEVTSDGGEERFYVLDDDIESLLQDIEGEGLDSGEFLHYYRSNPILPETSEKGEVEREFAEAKIHEKSRRLMEEADTYIEEAKASKSEPPRVLWKIRWAVEDILVAYYYAFDHPLPPYYIEDHDEGHFTGDDGLPKEKSGRRVVKEFWKLYYELDDIKNHQFDSWRGIKFIGKKVEDHVKRPEQGGKVDQEDVEALVSQGRRIRNEFMEVIATA